MDNRNHNNRNLNYRNRNLNELSVQELQSACNVQGQLVRQLKEAKAPKDGIDAAVTTLLNLKRALEAASDRVARAALVARGQI